jgi:hypothetical protein
VVRADGFAVRGRQGWLAAALAAANAAMSPARLAASATLLLISLAFDLICPVAGSGCVSLY